MRESEAGNGRTTRISPGRAVLVASILMAISIPVGSTFHFARIVEVFTGSATEATAQYVVIMPHSDNQTEFAGVAMKVFDSAGNALSDFGTFPSAFLDTSTNQRRILMATPTAQTLFGVSADQTAFGTLPTSGVICFRKPLTVPDCVAYGNFTGSTTVGGSEAGPPAAAPPAGSALLRDLGADGMLQSTDDTDNSALDFSPGFAAPGNFDGDRTQELTVSLARGDVVLSWAGLDPTTVHKTDSASTVRAAIAIATESDGDFTDPDPAQFTLNFYVIKP